MEPAKQILAELNDRGVLVSLRDGSLHVQAPKGVFSKQLQHEFKRYKDHIQRLITSQVATDPKELGISQEVPVAPVPLTAWQKGFWLMHRRADADLGLLNNSAQLILEGNVDEDRLSAAWKKIQSRFDILRARFHAQPDGSALQVTSTGICHLEIRNIEDSGLLDTEAGAVLKKFVTQPFDLENQPPLRGCLLKSPKSSRLVICVHHIAADGWSYGVLVQDLFRFYDEPDTILPASPSYLSYARQMAGVWEKPSYVERVKHEADRYVRLQSRHSFPVDFPPSERDSSSNSVAFQISAETRKQLEQLASSAKTTTYAILVTALLVLHRKLTGETRLPVMCPIANRHASADMEKIVGAFANASIIATSIASCSSFSEALDAVSTDLGEMYDRQDVSFDDALDQAKVQRVRGTYPVAQIALAFQDAASEPVSNSLDIEVQSVSDFGRQDFFIEFRKNRDGGLDSRIGFNLNKFQITTVEAFASALVEVLCEAAKGSDTPICAPSIPNQSKESLSASIDFSELATRLTMALGLEAGNTVCLDTPHDDKLARIFEQADIKTNRATDRPADLLLTSRYEAQTSHPKTILFNHIVRGAPALLTNSDYEPIAFLPGVLSETEYSEAVELGSGLEVVAHDGSRISANLPGFLALENARPRAKRSEERGLQIRTDTIGAQCVWNSGYLVDLEACASKLLQEMRVADAALSVENRNGYPALVAWICPSGPADYKVQAAMVRGALAGKAVIDHVVRLSSLPRTVDGSLDRFRLTLLPLNAPSIVSPLIGNGNNRVTVTPQHRSQEITHLSRLLPEVSDGSITALPRYNSLGAERDQKTTIGGEKPGFLEAPKISKDFPASGWNPVAWLDDHQDQPRKLSCLDHDGKESSQSFSSLQERCAKISTGLREAGLSPGNTVVIAPRRPADFLAAFLGAMQAGVTAAPVPPPLAWKAGDANFDRLIHVARLSGASHVVVNEPIGDKVSHLKTLQLDSLAAGRASETVYGWAADEIMLVSFTSGSTGKPKGVPLRAENIWAQPLSFGPAFGFKSGETALNVTSLDHVASLIGFCGSALLAGCNLSLISVERFLSVPQDVIDCISRWGIARSWAPDFALSLLADIIEERAPGSLQLQSLRAIYSAGECPLDATFAKLDRALKQHSAKVELRSSWGMAETTSLLTLSHAWDGGNAHARTCGVVDSGGPIAGNSVRVVDANDVVLQEGEVGLFQVRGTQVFRHYLILKEDGSTGYRSPFSEDGWMETGDLAYIQDGRVVFLGREKDVLILNGQNVAQAAIEDTVNALEGVDPSFTAAFASRREDTGEAKLIVLFCPLKDVLDRSVLIRKISGAIAAAYGVQPDHILPVERDDISKTGLGKIQRIKLRDAFEAGKFADLMHKTDLALRNSRTVPGLSGHWGTQHLLSSPAVGTKILLIDDKIGVSAALQRLLMNRGICTRHIGTNDLIENKEFLKEGSVIVSVRQPATAAAAAKETMERLKLVRSAAPLSEKTLRFLWIESGQNVSLAGAALSACLRHEFPHVVSQCVSVPSLIGKEELANLAELLQTPIGGHISRLKLGQNGKLTAPCLLPGQKTTNSTKRSFPDNATLFVPGGNGEIGRVLIRQLLAWTGWNFIVAGRRDTEAGDFFKSKRVENLQCDAADPVLLANTLQGRDIHGVINLTGRVNRTPLEALDAHQLQEEIDARLNVVEALDRVLPDQRILHVTSINADFGRHDFLGYSVANAVQKECIRELAPKHIDLPCGQWEAEGGPTGINQYLAERGYPLIDAKNGAAAVIRAFHFEKFNECLGLDLYGSEIAPFSDQVHSLDSVEVKGELAPEILDSLRKQTAHEHTSIVSTGSGGTTEISLNATESKIRKIWAGILEMHDDISPDANFFDIGGTSLLIARLLLKLQDEFGGPDDVLKLFSNSTIRAQARLFAATPEQKSTRQKLTAEIPPKPQHMSGVSMAQRRRAAIAKLDSYKD